MHARLNHLVKSCGIVLAIGLIYAFLHTVLNIQIPCVFNAVTGLYCPGCGVSRMCISLMKLDFSAAFHYNPAIMLSLPIFGTLGVQMATAYVREDRRGLSRKQTAVLWFLLIIFLLFGMIRNLPQFSFLAPDYF